MPDRPGMSRSTRMQSYELRLSAATAVSPSGQTVTSCPIRGSSRLINSCNDFSSSANSSFRRLCGLVAMIALLLLLGQRQAHAKFRATAWPVAVGLDLPVVISDDAIGNRKPQSDSLTGAAASEEGLEQMLEHF